MESERLAQGQTFALWGQGRDLEELEILSLDRFPLGTLLTIRETLPEGLLGGRQPSDHPQFALRNGDTGAYIPYGKLNNGREGEGPYRTGVYELYADVSGLKNPGDCTRPTQFCGGRAEVVWTRMICPWAREPGRRLCPGGLRRGGRANRPHLAARGAVINVSQCVPP